MKKDKRQKRIAILLLISAVLALIIILVRKFFTKKSTTTTTTKTNATPATVTLSSSGGGGGGSSSSNYTPIAPVINNPVMSSASSISGTGTPNAFIVLYINGANSGYTAQVAANGTWSISNLSLLTSQNLKATQSVGGVTSPLSVAVIVGQATPNAPVVNSPIVAGTTQTVSGQGVAGSNVILYINGNASGNATVLANGTWSIGGLTLVQNQTIKATQTVSGVVSTYSTDVIVGAIPIPAAPTVNTPIYSGSSQTISGTGLAGATVSVLVNGIAVAQNVSVGTNGSWSVGGVSINANQSVTATQTVNGGTSSPSGSVVVSQAAPNAPTINSPVLSSSTSVNGTGVAGANLVLYVNNANVGNVQVAANGTWSISGLTLLANQVLTATQTYLNVTSVVSNSVNVGQAQPNAPMVSTPVYSGASQTVSGTGTVGATLKLYVDNTLVSPTATVAANGVWSITGLALNAGQVLTATQTINSSTSTSSNSVTVALSVPNAPTNLTANPTAGVTTLNWSGVSGATSYKVMRSTAANGTYSQLANINATTFQDTTGVAPTTYFYKIIAMNTSGDSPDSNVVSATCISASYSLNSISVAPDSNDPTLMRITPNESNKPTGNLTYTLKIMGPSPSTTITTNDPNISLDTASYPDIIRRPNQPSSNDNATQVGTYTFEVSVTVNGTTQTKQATLYLSETNLGISQYFNHASFVPPTEGNTFKIKYIQCRQDSRFDVSFTPIASDPNKLIITLIDNTTFSGKGYLFNEVPYNGTDIIVVEKGEIFKFDVIENIANAHNTAPPAYEHLFVQACITK